MGHISTIRRERVKIKVDIDHNTRIFIFRKNLITVDLINIKVYKFVVLFRTYATINGKNKNKYFSCRL